jgi:hypothetical protein
VSLPLFAALVSTASTSSAAVPAPPPVVTDPGPDFELSFDIGKGFVVEKKDFARLELRVRGMFLYTLEAADETEHSFQVRRARFVTSGYVFGKENAYKMELALSPRDVSTTDGVVTTSPLLDLFFRFTYLRDLAIQVGQYKVPYNRERVVSSGDLEMVDRSIANAEFNLERDIGFDLRSKDFLGLDLFRYYAGIYVGEGRNTFALDDFGLMYLVRVEVLPLGLFDDYRHGDLGRSPTPKLSIGLSYAYLDNGKRNQGINGKVPADGGVTDFHNAEADVLFFWQGLSVMGELFFRDGARNIPAGAPEVELARDGYGFMIEPGYVVPVIPLQIVTRFSRVAPLGTSSLARASEAGAGLNYYFVDHAMKLQADVFHLWEGTDFSAGEDRFRLQLQAAF